VPELSCAKESSCTANEIVKGDYDVSYSAVSNDCGSPDGLNLPTKVTFGEAVTVRTLEYSTEAYALRGCPNAFDIEHYNTEWIIILTGDRFEEDGGGRVHATVMIQRFTLEGVSTPQRTPVCSATAAIEFAPRVTANSSSDSGLEALRDR
jgi:hypothetical protein